MNKSTILAALAASVVGGICGALIFGLLLGDFMKENAIHYEGLRKTPPVIWALSLSGFLYYLLLAIIYDKWADIRSFVPGCIAGLWIGFLTILTIHLSYYAFFNLYSIKLIVLDILVNTAIFGLIGGVIGTVLGFRNDKIAV